MGAFRLLLSAVCLVLAANLALSVAAPDVVPDYSGPHLSRPKRQAKPEYHVDVLAYLDYAFYSHWNNAADTSQNAEDSLRGYIAYIFEGVNKRYSVITDLPFYLRVNLCAIFIAKSPEDSPWTEEVKVQEGNGRPHVNAIRVLENLQQYVFSNYDNIPPHDHLMLFTRYDLVGEGKYTAGLAYVDTVCRTDGSSVSVIEDDGGAVSEATAAHELGHSLGAFHDGTNNSCSSEDFYAMTGSGANPNVTVHDAQKKRNLWLFSDCSLDYFRQTVQRLTEDGNSSNCLSRRETPRNIPNVPDNLPRHPDQQCRYKYNNSSYLCRRSDIQAEDICLKLACYNPDLSGNQCTVHSADTGTCCGKGKWCQQGQCVDSPDSKCSDISETCPFGDQPVSLKSESGEDIGECGHLHSAYCYEEEVRAMCCHRCEKARTDIANCSYGNKGGNCDQTYCSFPNYASNCCASCSDVITTGCVDVSYPINVNYMTPEGEKTVSNTCANILARPEMTKLCYSSEFRLKCCKSCEAQLRDDTGCPFGDAVTGCDVLLPLRRRCDDTIRAKCCGTCAHLDTLYSTQPSSPPPSTTTTTTTKAAKEVYPSGARGGDGQCGETCGVCVLGASVVVMALSLFLAFALD